MPIIIPTVEELKAMSSRDRERWAARMGVERRRVRESRAWLRAEMRLARGLSVADEARALEASTGPDPDAARHRLELLKALKGRGAVDSAEVGDPRAFGYE